MWKRRLNLVPSGRSSSICLRGGFGELRLGYCCDDLMAFLRDFGQVPKRENVKLSQQELELALIVVT